MKQGARSANSLGVVAVMYSGIGVTMKLVRDTEDELNTLCAATATGLLFKSTGGLRNCAKGGLAGLLLGALYCAYDSKDKIRSWSNS